MRSWCWLLVVLACAGMALAQEKDLAEPPFWPIGISLPAGVPATYAKGTQTPILAWVPEGAKHIRAVFLIMINSDSKIVGEHAAVRDVARKREMAIVYLRANVHYGLEKGADTASLQLIMDALAAKTGIAEFKYAPWISFGKSASGRFPFYLDWLYPTRMIASISYHAETPSWPVADWAKLHGETILHVNVNGQKEWGGTWYRHVRPALLNYRAQQGWLTHQAVAYGVGHGDYADGHGSPGWGKFFPGKVTCINVWDYLAVYIDKAIGLRVPMDKYATDGPVELKQVDETTGYLIEPFAIEELFGTAHNPLIASPDGYVIDGKAGQPGDVSAAKITTPLIRKYADVPEADRKKMFWVADEEQALAWLKLHMVKLQSVNVGP